MTFIAFNYFWNFKYNKNIYKSAIKWAKERNYHEIVELLSKPPKDSNEADKVRLQALKKENQSLRKENAEQRNIILRQYEEISLLKRFLSAMKNDEKNIEIYNIDDYEELPDITKSRIKIVVKKKQEKYVKKEFENFTREIFQQIVSKCDILLKYHHPCIIRIHCINYGDEKHPPSMILSREPKSLESAIHNKELSPEQKNILAIEIVLGMRYIHKQKLIHRNLKPSNILLSKKMHARISDFCLLLDENLEADMNKNIAAMRFMAPELFKKIESPTTYVYTNKVDIYSFGIILIYIITEQYPKVNIKNVINGVLPTLPSTIPNWVCELIFSCLSLLPENRPSFAEIFEIMKLNNYDMFRDKDQKSTAKKQEMNKLIEARILKIEAFEYQHQE